MPESRDTSDDWTRGPAKHAAAAVLLAATLAVVAFSSLVPRTPAATRPGAAAVSATAIDLNRASVDELRALPRIGPSLARRIADDRAVRGPFRSLDDLARVRGIGPRTIDAIRPYATVAPDQTTTARDADRPR